MNEHIIPIFHINIDIWLIWVCLKMLCTPKKTQWFCWSLSLLFMAISLGIYPTFSDIPIYLHHIFIMMNHRIISMKTYDLPDANKSSHSSSHRNSKPPAARSVEPKAARRRPSHRLQVGENMDMIWCPMPTWRIYWENIKLKYGI